MKDKAYIGDEIVEGNKLIAEFMGAKKSTVDNDGRYLRFPEPHAGTKTYAFYPNNLKYHSSWDWIMPVVDKLPEKHSYHFNDEQSEAVLVQLKDALFDADILKAWLTVVQFITWYNNQNKQSKQTIMKEEDKNTREYQELFYKFIQKNRVFYVDEVRAWLRAYREEEISFSRFVEIMNEKVFTWYNSQNKSNE